KKNGELVANCHRAPASWFTKKLLSVDWMVERLGSCITKLREINPSIQVMVTVSPVRHIRDGVQENNRSKARLFETIQQLEEKGFPIYYFPAYELVVDVLRDYRFYDIDLVHPNFAATEYVIEQFMKSCVETSSQELANEIKKLRTAFRHRPQHRNTSQHKEFLQQMFQKATQFQSTYPFLDFSAELSYFSAES
ncbi:MAG: GSCFA domain-containing protein, partial [Chitinophagaceae bacterium]|nr:GSCFA domain-containing protein [Chitinophagaceae bacterium]